MTEERFTASNGLYVENGQVYLPDGTRANADLSSVRAVVLIEYGAHKAQAQRDAELGRWRSVEHPDWVVYPGKPDESLPVRYQECVVVDERDGNRLVYGTLITSWYSGEGKEVAREFFTAHPVPEPKPWEQAETGEVWVLTVDGDDTRVVTSVGFEFQDFHGDYIRRLSDSITAGRRIWPEVSA